MTQVVECLPSMYKSLGSISQHLESKKKQSKAKPKTSDHYCKALREAGPSERSVTHIHNTALLPSPPTVRILTDPSRPHDLPLPISVLHPNTLIGWVTSPT
jgi:hypothetical protein